MKASKRMRGMMNEMRVARLRCGKNLWCRIQSRDRKLSFCMVLEVSAETVVGICSISDARHWKKLPPLRDGLRGGSGDVSQENQRLFFRSHQREGGKTHQS